MGRATNSLVFRVDVMHVNPIKSMYCAKHECMTMIVSSSQMQPFRDKDNQVAGTNKHTNIIQNAKLAHFMSYVQSGSMFM